MSPATICPTLPRTLPWRRWPTWAVPGGALKRSSRRRRATWDWTSTRPDGLVSATFTYQWLADDVAIDGATGSSYTVTDGEVGKAIRVRVSFTDNAGNAENLTSAATSAVTLPALRLQAAAVYGTTLTLTYNNDLETRTETPILPKPSFSQRRLSM